jgi:cell wall-associated NlpC family hydrolase
VAWYFDDDAAVGRLRNCLQAWRGTPYRHGCAVRRKGADCIHFVTAVLHEVGVTPNRLPVPDYPKDWHLHNEDSWLLAGVRKHVPAKEVLPEMPFMAGDILLFHVGRTTAHAGISLDGKVWHSLLGHGVVGTDRAALAKRMKLTHRFRAVKK